MNIKCCGITVEKKVGYTEKIEKWILTNVKKDDVESFLSDFNSHYSEYSKIYLPTVRKVDNMIIVEQETTIQDD